MLSEKELEQVREYVIKILPELLRKDPEIATIIEGILAQHFPRRDEFARLLDELQRLREQTDRRLEQIDQQLKAQWEELARHREELALHREELARHRDELALLREEMERRFATQHRELIELRRDVARLQHGHEMILKRLDGQEAWLRLIIGELRVEKGRTLEDLFAEGLRYGLKNPDITPEKLRLRQKLVDTTGQVFEAGFETEVDLIAEDDKLTVFEVKATAKPGDVGFFALEVKLVAVQNPDKTVEGVFIAPGAGEEIRQRCAEYGLTLVD